MTILATGALDAPKITATKPQRLSTFDWMRGLACVLMFQTHCYDSWLSPAARQTTFFTWSQLLGSLPAPLFLFLSGISAVLLAKKVSTGAGPNAAAARLVRRGLEIWGLGLLFRLQEYLIAYPWAPWTDLLRVDILNCIGVSLALVGLLIYVSTTWKRLALNASLAAAAIVLLAPLVWNHRFTALPWWMESYLNGVHNLGKPATWLFPIFPWAAFAFAGVVVGGFVVSDYAKRMDRLRVLLYAAAGALIAGAGYFFDHLPVSLYPERMYDFWHTSSGFFLIRAGILVAIIAIVDLRCRLHPVFTKSKALVLLGQHSLLVYWVHIEFVYGRLHILPRHALGIGGASLGLLAITLAMLLLAYLRAKWPFTFTGLLRFRATASS
ncbi:MAG: heparan-alpha-glucosaminide N-acetyltransferase domain-containing protein [Actinomycetota bacterium]